MLDLADGVPAPLRGHGKAVQIDPMKPSLKAHGTKRLQLKFDILLSNFAFKFNLRRYTTDAAAGTVTVSQQRYLAAGAHTPPLFSST